MAKPGPKPKPTKIHELEGGTKKTHRPLNKNEPKPDQFDEVPSPPEYLAAKAKEIWTEVAPQLHGIGILTQLDLVSLEGFCVHYAIWFDAIQMVHQGLIIKTKTGSPQITPALSIANNAAKQWSAFGKELGIGSPSERSRLNIKPDKDPEEDAREDFLKRGGSVIKPKRGSNGRRNK